MFIQLKMECHIHNSRDDAMLTNHWEDSKIVQDNNDTIVTVTRVNCERFLYSSNLVHGILAS